jgi:hypothetical protein
MDIVIWYLFSGLLVLLVEQSDQWFYMRRFNGVGTNLLTLIFWPVFIVIVIVGILMLAFRGVKKNG